MTNGSSVVVLDAGFNAEESDGAMFCCGMGLGSIR
jgi:hypothetical protein